MTEMRKEERELTASEPDSVHHPHVERTRSNDGIASERGSGDDSGRGSDRGDHGDKGILEGIKLDTTGRRRLYGRHDLSSLSSGTRTGEIGNARMQKHSGGPLLFQSWRAGDKTAYVCYELVQPNMCHVLLMLMLMLYTSIPPCLIYDVVVRTDIPGSKTR